MFRKLFVIFLVVCAVAATDETDPVLNSEEPGSEPLVTPESSEVTEVDDVITICSEEPPRTSMEDDTRPTTDNVSETENPVETSQPEVPGVIHPSSAQLQTNKSDEALKAIGVTTCYNDTYCSDFQDAYCNDGICHCKVNFVPHPRNGTLCLKKAEKLGEKCEISNQCEDFGVCRENVCAPEHIAKASVPINFSTGGASSLLAGTFLVWSSASLIFY